VEKGLFRTEHGLDQEDLTLKKGLSAGFVDVLPSPSFLDGSEPLLNCTSVFGHSQEPSFTLVGPPVLLFSQKNRRGLPEAFERT